MTRDDIAGRLVTAWDARDMIAVERCVEELRAELAALYAPRDGGASHLAGSRKQARR